MKLLFLQLYDIYNSVMDHNKNPLRHIPDPVSRLWIMTVLAWMWCIAFGLYVGSVIYMGISLVAHFGILFMIMFTAAIFYDAESRGDSWLLALRWEQLQYKIKLNRKKLNKAVSPELTTRLRYVITSVDGDNNQQIINNFVDNMLSKESLFLRDEIKRINPDIDLKQDVELEGETVSLVIPMTVEFFWPKAGA